jgi:hypothetical protein
MGGVNEREKKKESSDTFFDGRYPLGVVFSLVRLSKQTNKQTREEEEEIGDIYERGAVILPEREREKRRARPPGEGFVVHVPDDL